MKVRVNFAILVLLLKIFSLYCSSFESNNTRRSSVRSSNYKSYDWFLSFFVWNNLGGERNRIISQRHFLFLFRNLLEIRIKTKSRLEINTVSHEISLASMWNSCDFCSILLKENYSFQRVLSIWSWTSLRHAHINQKRVIQQELLCEFTC